MATTTYCDRSDIDDVLSEHAVDRMIDDDHDGVVEATELARVTTAIEKAAGRINATVQKRYTLSDLSGNDWLKFVNATLAALTLMRRRGNGVPPSLQEEADEYLEDLNDIKAGRQDIPEQNESFDFAPAVSNYRASRADGIAKVRVNTQISTGDDPHPSRKRFPARRHGHQH